MAAEPPTTASAEASGETHLEQSSTAPNNLAGTTPAPADAAITNESAQHAPAPVNDLAGTTPAPAESAAVGPSSTTTAAPAETSTMEASAPAQEISRPTANTLEGPYGTATIEPHQIAAATPVGGHTDTATGTTAGAAAAVPATTMAAAGAVAEDETKPVVPTGTNSPGTFEKLKKRFSILGSRSGSPKSKDKEHKRASSSAGVGLGNGKTSSAPIVSAETKSKIKNIIKEGEHTSLPEAAEARDANAAEHKQAVAAGTEPSTMSKVKDVVKEAEHTSLTEAAEARDAGGRTVDHHSTTGGIAANEKTPTAPIISAETKYKIKSVIKEAEHTSLPEAAEARDAHAVEHKQAIAAGTEPSTMSKVKDVVKDAEHTSLTEAAEARDAGRTVDHHSTTVGAAGERETSAPHKPIVSPETKSKIKSVIKGAEHTSLTDAAEARDARKAGHASSGSAIENDTTRAPAPVESATATPSKEKRKGGLFAGLLSSTPLLAAAEARDQRKKSASPVSPDRTSSISTPAAAVPPPPEKESKTSSVISNRGGVTISGTPATAEEGSSTKPVLSNVNTDPAAPATPEKTSPLKRDASYRNSSTGSKILAGGAPIAVGAAAATTATATDAATGSNKGNVQPAPPAVPAKDRPTSMFSSFTQRGNADAKMTSAGVAAEGKTPLISTDKSMPDYTNEARSLEGPKTEGLRQLWPTIEPFETGRLKVDDLHEIYWEWSGKPDGQPVVFLHGGPGGGISGGDRRWFDPSHYRVLCFDQRGAGQSTPPAELKGNTTWDLVGDIEKLRARFGIEKWHVFGGSWGSTLSLAYAQKHPERVSALILRGIFTLRKSELQFFYQDGASHIFPEQFKPYREHIPERERGDMIKAYYKRLTHKDEKVRLDAARRWSTWENATSKLYVDLEAIQHGEDDKWALAFARIESHYFINAGWMKDGQLLEKSNIDKIRHIPAVIVQGRYDVVCPATTAWKLHEAWPEAEFHLVPDCGHSAREPGIAHRLLEATDKLKSVN